MSHTVILRAFATVSEARICRSILETHGIQASIDNEEIVVQDWSIVPAVGGVHVRVPKSQLSAAKSALTDHLKYAEEILKEHALPGDSITTSQRWKAIIMLLMYLGFFNLGLAWFLLTLDSLIPPEWIPTSEPLFSQARVNTGFGISSPGPGAEGVVLVFLIAMILLWELISTRPEKPKKDPQV